MKVLVTGGAGYIGSTICTYLKKAGHYPVILDSLVTGNRDFVRDFPFYKVDIADKAALYKVKSKHPEIISVIHCAARTLVPESVSDPALYYRENVSKSTEFFKNCAELGIENLIFSSSASVYGTVDNFIATESSPTNPDSPYARTKLFMEGVLHDFCLSYGLRAVSLRYFNPIGTDPNHETGLYATNPSHILGKLLAVAHKKEEAFNICGTDYPTRDGTGIRDYIHVWDIARAHLSALSWVQSQKRERHEIVNLGTGAGITVREFVTAFEDALGCKINSKNAPPRPGDPAGAYASCEKAAQLFNWKAELSVTQAIIDSLIWSGLK